jgi:hypothetical protein
MESEILAAVKLPISEKWVLKIHFSGTIPSGSALFHNGLGDAERSAKPLCVGSIPTRASKIFYNLEPGRKSLAALKLPISEKPVILRLD